MLTLPKGHVLGEGLEESAFMEGGLTMRFYDWLRSAYKDPVDLAGGVAQSATEESIAADWYEQRARHARNNGDEETARLYEHIAKEERGHWYEFRTREGQLLP